MNRPTRIGLALAFAVPTLLGARVVFAESGTYESVYGFATNYSTIQHYNGTATAGLNRGTSTVVDSAGGLFVKGVSSAQECVILAKKSPAGIDVESYCTTTNPSGDKLYIAARRKAGEVSQGAAASGTAELVGGTGGYAGISGNCTYTVQFLPENRAVATSKCQWQKP